MRQPVASALLGVLCAVLAAAQDPNFGATTQIQLPSDKVLRGALAVDFDGDGRDDIVLAVSNKGRTYERSLWFHQRRPKAPIFANVPDVVITVPPDVVGFAMADVADAPGPEVLFFTSSAVHSVTWRDKDARPAPLLVAETLFQPADRHAVFVLSRFVVDVDSDGLDDLLIPEPSGYRIAVQRRDDSGARRFETAVIEVIADDSTPSERAATPGTATAIRSGRRRVSLALGDGEDEGPLLQVAASVPAPILADFDGDGDPDVWAQSTRRLRIFSQGPAGRFAAQPTWTLELPVIADRARRLDVSYSAHVADLNGDGRGDCVMLAGDRRAKDVRTQVLTYVNAAPATPAEVPLFGKEGLPTQLLVVAGFAGEPRLVDVNSDGLLDLTLGALRIDDIDVLRAQSTQTFDAEVYVFLGSRGGFSTAPDLRHVVKVKIQGIRSSARDLTARFFGDVTGDGVRELFVRDTPEHVALYWVRKAPDGWKVLDEALWETNIDEDAEIIVTKAGSPTGQELLILESSQVLHVRFE